MIDIAEEIVQIFEQAGQPVVKTVKIMGLMTGQYYTSQPLTFFDHLSVLVTASCYQTLILDCQNNSPDSYLAQQLTYYPESQMINGLPLYLEKSEEQIKVHYCYLVHSNYINLLQRSAFIEYEKNMVGTKYFNFKVLSGGFTGGYYDKQTPRLLFPSSDFNRIKTILENHVNISSICQPCQPLVLRVSGETGTGKTSLATFLSAQRIFSHIYKIDMIKMSHMAPEHVFRITLNRILIQGSTLLVFDNIDKYLEQYYSNDELEKMKFYNLLLTIIERYNNIPVVLLFCCSNSDLADQLQPISVQLDYYDREEVCNYLRFYNNKYSATKYYEPDLESHLTRLIQIEISPRELSQISIQYSNNMIKIIEALLIYTKPTINFINSKNIKNKLIINQAEPAEQVEEDEYKFTVENYSTKCFQPGCPVRTTNKYKAYFYCPDHLPLYICNRCQIACTESMKCYHCFAHLYNKICRMCQQHYIYDEYDDDVSLCSPCNIKYVTCEVCSEIVPQPDQKRNKADTYTIRVCSNHITNCKNCDEYCSTDFFQLEGGGALCENCYYNGNYINNKCDICYIIKEGQPEQDYVVDLRAPRKKRTCDKCLLEIAKNNKNEKNGPSCLKCSTSLESNNIYCAACQPATVCRECLIDKDLNQLGFCTTCSHCITCNCQLKLDLISMTYKCYNCNTFICSDRVDHRNDENTQDYKIINNARVCAICDGPEYIVSNGEYYRLTCQSCYTVKIDTKICSCPQCLKLNEKVSLGSQLDVAICCHNCGQLKLSDLEPVAIKPHISLSAAEIDNLISELKPEFKSLYFDIKTKRMKNLDACLGYFNVRIYNIINEYQMIYAMLRSNYGFALLKCINDLFVNRYMYRRHNLLTHRKVIAKIWTKVNLLI